MTTFYIFHFKCQLCGNVSNLRYRVPSSGNWVKLSCKNCERPLLSIDFYCPWDVAYYKVYDEIKKTYILGDKDNSVGRDSFWGWVSDHGGDRVEE